MESKEFDFNFLGDKLGIRLGFNLITLTHHLKALMARIWRLGITYLFRRFITIALWNTVKSPALLMGLVYVFLVLVKNHPNS